MTFQQVGAVAAKVVNRWKWWQDALAGNFGEITSTPEQGYYRTKNVRGVFEPVAIWFDEETGKWVAYRANREVHADEVWSFCCRHPVSYEAYDRAVTVGGWADDDETVAAQIAAPGHNSGDVDETEVLRDQIEAAKKGAEAYAKITDDATLTKAQSLRARLNELAGEADKKREALKRPHFEAGKAIDKEWQPLVKDAKAAADGIRAAMNAYETEKLRKQREEERKAEEARRRAEDDARKAAEAGKPVVAPELPPEPVVAAPTPIKGTYGKAAARRVKMVVTGITNAADLFAFLNGHPKLDDLMLKLAQEYVDGGQTVPGVTTEEQVKVS